MVVRVIWGKAFTYESSEGKACKGLPIQAMIEEKIQLTNIFNNFASFLSCKIYCTKRKYYCSWNPELLKKDSEFYVKSN